MNRTHPFLRHTRIPGISSDTQAYTCCRNCGRRNNCPAGKRETCTHDNHSCSPCDRWNRWGCRYFVLDWSVMNVKERIP